MKNLTLIFVLLITPMTVKADASIELLEVMGGKEQMHQLHQQFITMLARGNPGLAAHQDVIKQWAEKYLTWDEMKTGLSAVYKKHFTESEIKELLAFYKTPTGKKSIEKMPLLFREGSEVGVKQAEKYQPQLQQMLEQAQAKDQPAK